MTTAPTPRTMLDRALILARYGYFVHPLKPRDKKPIAAHGSNDATRDEAQIRAWWQENPNYNVGISLDKTGLVDIAPDSEEWATTFEARGLPPTMRYSSGGGAGHYHNLYRLPAGGPVSRSCVPDNYDIMSQGNAVAPGSIHPSGHAYALSGMLTPVEDLPLAPAWAVEMLQAHVNADKNEHTPEDWQALPSGATLAQSRRFQALCKANDQLRAVCAGEPVILTTKSGGKDSTTSIQRAVFVKQLIRAKYPHSEIRALALHFSGVLESSPKTFETDIDRLLFKYTPKDYAPESTGVVATVAPRGGRHYEITAAELLDRYHEHADCGPKGIILDWTVEDAAARLGVSTGTIKRREAELTEAGEIKREYGHVILAQAEIRSQPIETQETAADAECSGYDIELETAKFADLADPETEPIGSQFDIPQPNAPNVPKTPVCVERACVEITHAPPKPLAPARLVAEPYPLLDRAARAAAELEERVALEAEILKRAWMDKGKDADGNVVWTMKRAGSKRTPARQRTVQAEIQRSVSEERARDRRIERLDRRVWLERFAGRKPTKRAQRLGRLLGQRRAARTTRMPAPAPYREPVRMEQADLPGSLGAVSGTCVLSRAEGPPPDGSAMTARLKAARDARQAGAL